MSSSLHTTSPTEPVPTHVVKVRQPMNSILPGIGK